jgi:hypothetical protein
MNNKELNFIKENYFTNTIGVKDLMSLINEVYESAIIDEQQSEPNVLTLQSIPDISVTELGWTDVKTVGDKEVSGPARNQLMQFTKNIQGSDLQEKLKNLALFYENPEDALTLDVGNPGQRIANALSYLVFYKTLTKVISNFNAASAGFNFEAFLAVLLEGAQIQANTGTIADFKTKDNTPISLKLYNEKSVVVGGSFNDLVGDLVEPQFSPHDFMQYVVVMKSFEDVTQGLDVKGDLKFYRFDFNLDNVANLILDSMDKSVRCIEISSEFIQRVEAGESDFDFSTTLPAQENLSPEELESKFIQNFADLVTNPIKYTRSPYQDVELNMTPGEINSFMTNQLDWAKNDELFTAKQFGEEMRVIRGRVNINNNKEGAAAKAVDSAFGDKGYDKYQLWAVRWAISQATQQVNKEYSAKTLKTARAEMLAGPGVFADAQTSVNFYNKLDSPEMKKRALMNSRGRLSNLQFDLNRSQVVDISENIGQIKIGAQYVQEVLNKMTQELNESIFSIFQSVKMIQEGTYAFMAGGLQDDSEAEKAITASQDVQAKTQELRPQGGEQLKLDI